MRISTSSAVLVAFLASPHIVGSSPYARAADPPKDEVPAPAAPAAPTTPAAAAVAPTVVPIAPPPQPSANARARATTATFWGHSAFVIVTPGGASIAIDPWLDNPSAPKGLAAPTSLDAILVTHGHFDHVSGVPELAKRTGAHVVAPYELVSLLGVEHASGMTPGGSIKIKDATVHMVEAVHGGGYTVDPKNVRYGGAPMGFVITIDKGPTIYHAGDTDVFASMALIAERYRPTVALLPIGGYFTMDPAGAAVAARLLKVRTVIPMHFGTFPQLVGSPADLRTEMRKQHLYAKVLAMKPGETTKL